MLLIFGIIAGATALAGFLAGGISAYYESEQTELLHKQAILEAANKKLIEENKGLERELQRMDQGFQLARLIDSAKKNTRSSTPVSSTEPSSRLPPQLQMDHQGLPYGFVRFNNKPVSPIGDKLPLRSKKSRKLRRSLKTSPWAANEQDGHSHLVPLEDSASVSNQDTSNATFKTRVLESGLIAPALGLVMEQTGSYMEYAGYLYIPIIYHMPHLAGGGLKGQGIDCNITANPGHQELIIQLLTDKVGTLIPIHDLSRKKRFIETVLLGGAVAWNRASIWSLQDTVSSLENQIQIIRDGHHIVTDSINTLMDNQNAIHHSVDRQARILRVHGAQYMQGAHNKLL